MLLTEWTLYVFTKLELIVSRIAWNLSFDWGLVIHVTCRSKGEGLLAVLPPFRRSSLGILSRKEIGSLEQRNNIKWSTIQPWVPSWHHHSKQRQRPWVPLATRKEVTLFSRNILFKTSNSTTRFSKLSYFSTLIHCLKRFDYWKRSFLLNPDPPTRG